MVRLTLILISLFFLFGCPPMPQKEDRWIQYPVKISYVDEGEAHRLCFGREACTRNMGSHYWVVLNRENPFCDDYLLKEEFKHIINQDKCLGSKDD